MNWQPIETAPKDGTRVILFREGYAESMTVCYYAPTWTEWFSVQGGQFSNPTHWMPIPKPPI